MLVLNRAALKIFYLSIGVAAALFIGQLGVYLVPLQIKAYIDALGLSEGMAGTVGFLEIAAMSITATLVSKWVPLQRVEKTAYIGIVLVLLFQCLTAVIPTSYLMILRLGVGLGSGLVFASACAISSASSAPETVFGLAQALMNVFFVLAFMFAPAIMQIAPESALFLFLATMVAALSPLVFLLKIRDVRRPLASRTPSNEEKNASLGVLALFGIGTVTYNVGMGGFWGFVERFGSIQVGLDPVQIGNLLSMATVFMVLGSLTAALVGDTFGRLIPVVAAIFVSGCSAIIMSWASTPFAYAIALFLYNFSYLFTGPYIIAGIASEIDPSGRLAAAAGGIMFLSYAAGIAAAGMVSEFFSLAYVPYLTFGACLIAIPFFLMLMRYDLGMAATAAPSTNNSVS